MAVKAVKKLGNNNDKAVDNALGLLITDNA
jgi:hypothetical protein